MTFASNLADFQTTQDLFREFSEDYGSVGFRMLGFARKDPIFKENMQEVASMTSQLVEIVSVDGGIAPTLNQYLQLRASLQTRLNEIQSNLTDNVNTLNRVANEFSQLSVEASEGANETRNDAEITLVVTSIIVLLVSVFIGVFVVQSIKRPLRKLRSFIIKVGHGDLTSTIGKYSADELGDISKAMDQLVVDLKGVVLEISEQSDLVSKVSKQTSKLAEETREKTNLQQQDISQSVYSVGEMSQSIKEVAVTAETTSQEMQVSESEAHTINQGMLETVESISRLNERMQKAVDVIHTLDQGVISIESILETIQTIAEQTNLLALNAAIEAARAGEQGRGFAVVADEVRTLATRTQSSTEEIREKINSIQSQSTSAVETISSSQESTAEVTETAKSAGEKFTLFMSQFRNLSSANVSIAAAAEEQSATTEEMSRLMKKIGEVTEDTTRISQEVAEGVRSLNVVADDLDDAVHRFKIN
jgi:methyl-accepting chemotaxis protein